MTRKTRTGTYSGPAGGWGSLRSVAEILMRERVAPLDAAQLLRQNKPDGFMCVSCAWPKPEHPHPAEFCENGAKATAWEITSLRAGPEFGATTLSRFYAIHMLLIPGLLAGLIGAHLYLVAKLGTTAPPWIKADDAITREERA